MEAGQTEAEEGVLTVASSLRHPLRRYTTAQARMAASHHRRTFRSSLNLLDVGAGEEDREPPPPLYDGDGEEDREEPPPLEYPPEFELRAADELLPPPW